MKYAPDVPNLSLTKIAATLAALGSLTTSCTKQEIAPDPAKATEVPSSTIPNATFAGSSAPPPPVVAATAAPEPKEKDKNDGADASVVGRKGAPGGATSGQMSCGAGKCSGEVSGKKK